jgi:rare lipoprotein A
MISLFYKRNNIIKWIALLSFFVFSACGLATVPSASVPPDISIHGKPSRKYLLGQKPYELFGVWYYPIPSAHGYTEEGVASWYGKKFHNRPTSSGELYNMFAMTAAHKTLPLGTHVKVTNLENNKKVLVRINDRGPFVAGRVIDLSHKAASNLDMLQPGTAPVRVETIQIASKKIVNGKPSWRAEPVPDFRYGKFNIQIGSFQALDNALKLKETLGREYGTILIQPFVNGGGGCYRVRVGTFRELTRAYAQADLLRQKGFAGAFVVAMEDAVRTTSQEAVR